MSNTIRRLVAPNQYPAGATDVQDKWGIPLHSDMSRAAIEGASPAAQRYAFVDGSGSNNDGPNAPRFTSQSLGLEPEAVAAAPAPAGWRSASDAEMVAPIVGKDGKPVPGHVPVPQKDLQAYGQRYREAIGNTIDRGVERRQAQRRAGIDPDAPPVAAAPAAPQGPLPEPGPYDADPQYQKDMAAIAQIADPVEKAQRMQVANGQALDRKVFKEHGFTTAGEFQRKSTPDHIKRRQFLETIARRYAPQIAAGEVTLEQLFSAYDSGAAGAQMQVNKGGKQYIDRHGAGIVSARNITDTLAVGKAIQTQLNVNRAHEQNGLAYNHRVPRGAIMAQQDVQARIAAGDMAGAAAQAAMYGMHPKQMEGWWGAVSAEAKAKGEQEPPQPGLVDTWMSQRAKIDTIPPGQRLAPLEGLHRQLLGGKDAQEDAVKNAVRNDFKGTAQKMVARGVGELSPEERAELQQVVHGMGYDEFLRYVGKADSPDMRQMHESLTGQGRGWGGVAGTVADWLMPDFVWNAATGLMGD